MTPPPRHRPGAAGAPWGGLSRARSGTARPPRKSLKPRRPGPLHGRLGSAAGVREGPRGRGGRRGPEVCLPEPGAPPSAGTHTERRKLPGFVRGTQFTAVTPEGLPQTACDLTQLTSFSVRVWGRGGNSSVSGNLIGILAVYSFGNSKPEPVLGDLCKPAPRDQGRLVCRHQDRASGPAAAASPAGQSRGGEGAGAGGPLPRPRARALGGGL